MMVFWSRMIVTGVFNKVQVNPNKPFALVRRMVLEMDCAKPTGKKDIPGTFFGCFLALFVLSILVK